VILDRSSRFYFSIAPSGIDLPGRPIGTDTVRVERPHHFCNPVEKVAGGVTSPILEPDVHLTCYGIFAPQRTRATAFGVRNQIEPEDTFTITAFELLCVPSAKLGVEPVPVDTRP